MGRKTYEFGCKFGLQPEQPAYPHMLHFIFSDNFTLENADSKVQFKKINLNEIELIQKQRGSYIYLCGGGEFTDGFWIIKKLMFLNLN